MKNRLEIQILTLFIGIASFNYVTSVYFDIYKNMDLPRLVPKFTFEVLEKRICATIAARYCPYSNIDSTGSSVGIDAFTIKNIGTKVICQLYKQASQAAISSDTTLYLRQKGINTID